jgi:DNA-binding NtrC family response regulator
VAPRLLGRSMARRILIVEDDDLLRAQLCRLFTGRGYEVETAASISEFVAAVAASRFDACLFDLSLPDGNGLEAWARARAHQREATAVLMTAYGTDEVARRAVRLGVHTILGKPLDLPVLLAAVGSGPR